MDSLYRRGTATVVDIQADLPDPPTDSAIRAMLRLLEKKRQVVRAGSSRPQVYRPALERGAAGLRAVKHLISTFFEGSRERAIQAILDAEDTQLNAEEVRRLSRLIANAQKAERDRGA